MLLNRRKGGALLLVAAATAASQPHRDRRDDKTSQKMPCRDPLGRVAAYVATFARAGPMLAVGWSFWTCFSPILGYPFLVYGLFLLYTGISMARRI